MFRVEITKTHMLFNLFYILFLINASGVIGDSKYALNNSQKGTPYIYYVLANFSGSHGTGKRMKLQAYIYNLTFLKTMI